MRRFQTLSVILLFTSLILVQSSFSLAPTSASTPKFQNALLHRAAVSTTTTTTRLSSTAAVVNHGDGDENREDKLPRTLLPITMGVLAQMLGEGIALSSLPLYLTRRGASPTAVGAAISCFSLSQMTFAPLLVGLSGRIGRSAVLRICLAGAASSSLLIAFSRNAYGIIAGRALAGVFAACVPVAQSAVTDVVPKRQTALGLSRVSAAAQLGVVVGPAASAIFQEAFRAVGVTPSKCLPAVFCLNAVLTLAVLMQMTLMHRRSNITATAVEAPAEQQEKKLQKAQKGNEAAVVAVVDATSSSSPSLRYAQLMLRIITIVMGWTAILSNSIYGLFAPRFLNFSQPHLSATYSFAAAIMVGTQVIFPRIVKKFGEHAVCTMGVLMAGLGIGGQSLVRFQPLHTSLYMMNRAGAAMADTATAALVAESSRGSEARSRNLALLTSTRAAARIVTPLVSSKLFEWSCYNTNNLLFAGALPFVTAAGFAVAVAPLPTLLKRAEQRLE